MTFHLMIFLHIIYGYAFLTNAVVLSNPYPDSVESPEFRSDSGICNTAVCKQEGIRLKNDMDESVDPCKDFFQFACGGYRKHPIPENKKATGVYSEVADRITTQIQDLLKKSLSGSEPKFVVMLKNIYGSCMDIGKIDEASSKPLQNILHILGGWPVVLGDKWDESKFDWLETLLTMRKTGFEVEMFFETTVDEDIKNNEIYIITIDQPRLGLYERSYYMDEALEDPRTKSYIELMIEAANKLGADEKTSRKELLEAFNFEKTLAQLSLPPEARMNYTVLYNKYTVKELQNMVPKINWLKYLNGICTDKIEPTENVLVVVPSYVKSFAELITKTNKRVIANYMIWKAVFESMSLLSKDWKDLLNKYPKISFTDKSVTRWEQCSEYILGLTSIAISSYYAKNYFTEDKRQKAVILVKDLHKEFQSILQQVDWMDEQTKAKAIEKAEALAFYVGYPTEVLDDNLVSQYYNTISTTKEGFFNNILSLNKWKADRAFSKLRKRNIKGKWEKHCKAADYSITYNSLENGVDIPAGILQKPLFEKDKPNYLNFGAIGTFVGRTMIEGFDEMGSQMDKDGNNVEWWDESTQDKFFERASCIIKQYGNYVGDNQKKLNGVDTMRENIADDGGIKIAYQAYQSLVKANGEEKKLPGLKYTPNQLFWISAANVLCTNYKPEYYELLYAYQIPDKYRVMGSFGNREEFSKDFQCPPDSPMNPSKKCQVW